MKDIATILDYNAAFAEGYRAGAEAMRRDAAEKMSEAAALCNAANRQAEDEDDFVTMITAPNRAEAFNEGRDAILALPVPEAPAPAAKPDMRAICAALGFDPENHHNAAACPYCTAAAPASPADDPEHVKQAVAAIPVPPAAVVYADHSYPAYSAMQMREAHEAGARAALAAMGVMTTAAPATIVRDDGPEPAIGDLALCKANRDGDCSWKWCPQIRDNEPEMTGRHCPIDGWCDGDEPDAPQPYPAPPAPGGE